MNRRKFLGSLLGLAASPAVSALPLPEISGISIINRYFSGDLGCYENSIFWGEQWSRGELIKMSALNLPPLSFNRIRIRS